MSDLNKCDVAAIKYIQKLGSRDMELIIPHNQEIVNIDGRYILRDKKLQYPKTYGECCDILKINPFSNEVYGYERNLISALQALITCRNAYWKIAGEEMGLDKPWEPDLENDTQDKYAIGNVENKLYLPSLPFNNDNKLLSFPTKEIRDAFYENFKDLIEQCKELL